jgi:hypothetical protein
LQLQNNSTEIKTPASCWRFNFVWRNKMRQLRYSISIIILSLFYSTAFSQTFTSTTQPIQLIELYTSEGCSSCPPADKWLNKLKFHPKLWSEFIPVAFHVDYWDYIGWQDPFASKQFSARQRQYARESNLSSVYTPAMLLNGNEWTSWRRQSRLKLPSIGLSTGTLSVRLNNGKISAHYKPTEPQASGLVLNVAILGFDVESKINAGENNGRTFSHDFIVLGFQRLAMKIIEDGSLSATLEQLPALSQHSNKLAISTWINKNESLTPLQATGGRIK